MMRAREPGRRPGKTRGQGGQCSVTQMSSLRELVLLLSAAKLRMGQKVPPINNISLYNTNENYDIAIAMSSSLADPVLGQCPGWGYLNIYISMPLPWLGVFKYLIQCHCPGWRYLNIYISVTALAGGI